MMQCMIRRNCFFTSTRLLILTCICAFGLSSCTQDTPSDSSKGGGSLSSTQPAKDQPITLKLPPITETFKAPKGLPEGLMLYVAPVEDARSDKDKIGFSGNGAYVTDESPSDYVGKNIVTALKSAGLNVTEKPADATRIIQLSLTRYWCDSSMHFHGEIRVTAEVTDASGATLWRGELMGTSSTGGLPWNTKNAEKVMSNSMVQVIDKLMEGSSSVLRSMK